MKQTKPKVSVLIPLYNAEKYIGDTLQSVLHQTYQNFEVIIVDDSSTDNSLEIVKSYKDKRMKIICNESNRGIAYTRNIGLSYCDGKYIALLDDDDIAINTRLEKQVSFLESHNDYDAVGGNAQWIDADGKMIRDTIEVVTDFRSIRMFLLFRNIFNNSEMTFRRTVIEENSMKYKNNCFGLEDFLFWIQFSKIGKMSNIPDLVLLKRVHKKNETAHMKNEKMKERKEKFLELQIYSLMLDGFKLEQRDEQVLKKFFTEESLVCKNEREFNQLAGFLKRILCQAVDMKKEYCLSMKQWFEDMQYWNLENIKLDYLDKWSSYFPTTVRKRKMDHWYTKDLLTLISMNRRFAEKEQYIAELIEAKNWQEQHCEELKRYMKELIEAKEWLERHSKEQEEYIKELMDAKNWLEQHSNEQEEYIKELMQAKDWLEQHSKDQEEYIAMLESEKRNMNLHIRGKEK